MSEQRTPVRTMEGSAKIARAMFKFVNSWPDKPVAIRLDILEKNVNSMMLQQTGGSIVTSRYADGSYRGTWSFAISVRVSGEDSSVRLNAISIINELGGWMEDQSLPVLGDGYTAQSLAMASYPVLVGGYPDGSQDYQSIFNLTYLKLA